MAQNHQKQVYSLYVFVNLLQDCWLPFSKYCQQRYAEHVFPNNQDVFLMLLFVLQHHENCQPRNTAMRARAAVIFSCMVKVTSKIMSKKPIRTYQRKATKKPFMNPLTSAVSSEKYFVGNSHFKNELFNDSLNYDLFETTFDRLAKDVVVPPMPLDKNQNDSWESSSSDGDITNAASLKSEHIDFDSFIHNSTPSSTNVSHKSGRTYRKPKKSESEVMVSIGMLSKKTKKVSVKDKIYLEKAQGKKRQANKIKKKKELKNKSKPSRVCNEQISHINSNALDNLEDVSYKNDILCSNTHESLLQNILKIDKTITSQNQLVTINESIADFKHIGNYQQIIKPCFVILNPCTVQNYILNHEKFPENKQDILHDSKCLLQDTLQTKKNISKVQSTVSRSISIEHNEFDDFKHTLVKHCSVVLCNNIKDQHVLQSKRNEDTINIEDKSNISHSVFCNSSEITPNCNKSIEFTSYDTKKKRDLIKNSFVKVERLEIGEFAKENNTVFEKKQNIFSSTPFSKRVKSSLVALSPINSNIYNKSHWSQEGSLITTEEDISDIDQKNSHSLFTISKDSKLKFTDVQEQQTQILLSQKSQTTDSVVKNGAMSYKNDVHAAVTQKYNTECDVKTEIPYLLNVSTYHSRSLFDDTTYSHNHSPKNTNEDKIKKKRSDTCKFIETIIVDSSIDLCLKQKQLSKAIHESLKDKTVNKHSLFDESRDNINMDARVLLTRLDDPIRIGRRMQYPKWHLSMVNISDSVNNEAVQSNNEVHYVTIDKDLSNVQSAHNSEHSKNANLSRNHFKSFMAQSYSDANEQMNQSIFLTPGKSWARSLSILNNINDESNLDELNIGKGKKWRDSVRNILDMQKQGIFQSCLKKGKDDTNLSSGKLNISNASSFNSNKCKEFDLASYPRFSKRISVRVVLNSTNTKYEIKDTPFLEAFGITAEKFSNSKLSYREKSLIHNNQIISNHSSTARDVVLQRCSQNCYIPFEDCFPDLYLKHCHKIGEGVYGEVFLHECEGKKSVIKIIPIESEQLVNGEPQKKFNEILSEIVIAKELDNLKLNDTYKTNGFVEVKNISCITGKYPEKLLELWNIYDNEKTSDNDSPSMFDENQLYIVFELSHGGEDLEAFLFQTAEEACALFLQTALALAVAEKALEFEHRDLHWGNVLISRTKEQYIYYNLGGREIKFPSKGVKVSIIDFTLSRMLYQGCCIYNDLALDPALFTAHGEYQFEIYRLMRDTIQNDWRKFEPYTNVLWLHYILDKMITAVRYKKKNLKVHKHAVIRLKEFKDIILNYNSAYDFVINSNSVV
ncbi:Putative serine/threonine-protein kinase haspin like protein [Trachymyrmex cornetzi]|uniref:non-specific serine/threonine protein kinase n=1 Tax=Trachymyrmex cornetzi TaxID=471704 RepID=A0A195ELE5_9HYME|nr:Putative serine/threonine-protein kinase haspin like protein [Trachymyrmex cornetzi]